MSSICVYMIYYSISRLNCNLLLLLLHPLFSAFYLVIHHTPKNKARRGQLIKFLHFNLFTFLECIEILGLGTDFFIDATMKCDRSISIMKRKKN